MARRDTSLTFRFLLAWLLSATALIAFVSVLFFLRDHALRRSALQRDTATLAAVLAPRVVFDWQSHMATYAHKTLRSVQSQDNSLTLSLYGPRSEMLFSTHPVFRRSKEIPAEVGQVLAAGRPAWTWAGADERVHAFYPLFRQGKVQGVLQITRKAENLAWASAFRALQLALFCLSVAGLASALIFVLLKRLYFRPLKELNAMLASWQEEGRDKHPPFPESDFHGELALLYRQTAQLSRALQEAQEQTASPKPIAPIEDPSLEEMRALAKQIFEDRMARPQGLPGYETRGLLPAARRWGNLWHAVVAGPKRVVFSFTSGKEEDLKGMLKALQWEESLKRLVQEGKGLERLCDELFLEYGSGIHQWLLGQWNPASQQLELMGNAWACRWDHDQESFSFFKNAKPLAGRVQGFLAQWDFRAGDKLIFLNDAAPEPGTKAGWDAFIALLSKNIQSSAQNLADMLGQEMQERRFFGKASGCALFIHEAQASYTPSTKPLSYQNSLS